MEGHYYAIRTFENVSETHDPISMRSQVQYWAGDVPGPNWTLRL